MSHQDVVGVRITAKAAILEAVRVQLGTGQQRSAAWPHAATPALGDAMDGLDQRGRQLLLWEIDVLLEKIREYGGNQPSNEITFEAPEAPTFDYAPFDYAPCKTQRAGQRADADCSECGYAFLAHDFNNICRLPRRP